MLFNQSIKSILSRHKWDKRLQERWTGDEHIKHTQIHDSQNAHAVLYRKGKY